MLSQRYTTCTVKSHNCFELEAHERIASDHLGELTQAQRLKSPRQRTCPKNSRSTRSFGRATMSASARRSSFSGDQGWP